MVGTGAFLISFSPVFVNLAHVGPATAGFYRLLFGGIGLLVLATRNPARSRLGPSFTATAAVLGALLALDLICWHASVGYVGPGLATILGNFQVFVVAAFGLLVLGERLSWRLAAAIPLALAGLFLLVGADWGRLDREPRLGVILGLATALFYGAYILGLRRSQAIQRVAAPAATLAALSLMAVVPLAAAALLLGESLRIPDAQTWVVLVAYGVVSQVVGWHLIASGVAHIDASRVGLLLLLQPALAFVWDVLFFGRPTSGREAAGVALALGAIYLGARREAGRDREKR